MITILDELDKKTVEQLGSMMVEDLEKAIKDDLETCVQMDDQLNIMIEKLQQITGKNMDTSIYIGFQKCQSKLSEAKCLVEVIRQNDGMKFKSDESVVPFLRNLYNLGNVERVHVCRTQSSAKYNVKIKEDNHVCDIVGICGLPDGEVIIADNANNRVKLLDRKYYVTNYCDLPGSPHHLFHITGNDVAVAIFNTLAVCYEVHYLKVTRGKLQRGRKFTTDHDSWSIAHHQGQLFVSLMEAGYLYTVEGKFVKKINETCGSGLQVDKYTVSIDGERIYLTNLDDSKFITLDKTGQVLSTLEDADLQGPHGLCVSLSGHVFVCGLASDTVLQVDKEGDRSLPQWPGRLMVCVSLSLCGSVNRPPPSWLEIIRETI